ncbi:CCC1 protein [Trichoderma velutinum]
MPGFIATSLNARFVMAALLKSAVFGRGRRSSDLDYAPLSDCEAASYPALATLPILNSSAEIDCGGIGKEIAEKKLQDQPQELRENSSRLHISPRVISDAIIGLSDGLTVPFALTAGLSALGNSKTVIYGGLAELIAGSISMGLGGYLGAKSEAESYRAARSQIQQDVAIRPHQVKENVSCLFTDLGIPSDIAAEVTKCICESPKLTDFILRFEHSMPEPPSNRAISCALTIAIGYFSGGFIPLIPYIFVPEEAVKLGLLCSSIVMICTLFVFGYVKTCVVHGWSGWPNYRKALFGGLEMVIIGSVAAGAAMGLVYAFSSGIGK